MKGCLIALAVLAVGWVDKASAEAFTCIGRDSQVSFASAPYPDYMGEAMLQRPAQSCLSSDWEERDFPHRLNKNATDILQVSRVGRSSSPMKKKSPTTCRASALLPPVCHPDASRQVMTVHASIRLEEACASR